MPTKLDPSTLGVKIRKLRQNRQWSQLELSVRCNLSQSQVSRIESGGCFPSFNTLLKITQALEVPFSELS